MSKRMFKPERCYRFLGRVTEASLKNAFETGEVVTGRIREFDIVNGCFFVKLNKTIEGVLPFSECFLKKINQNYKHIPEPVEQLLKKKKVRVRITKWTEKQIYLSRRDSLLEVFDKAQHIVGKRGLFAVVENVTSAGLQCDIGEGLVAHCPVQQVSKTFINDITNWYKKGDIVKVVITSIDVNHFKVDCSIKKSDACDYSKISPGSYFNLKVGNPIIQEDKLTGYFVEVSPGICGIADIKENLTKKYANLKPGDIVRCQVKAVFPKEKRVKLIIIE